MSRTSCVERQSLSSQFLALLHERDNLQSAIDGIDRERSIVLNQLNELKNVQDLLTHAGRESQQKLGSVSGQRTLWKEEGEHLSHQTQEECEKLLRCTKEAEKCEEDEKERRERYFRQMTNLNENSESLLRQLETSRLKLLLTPETLPKLHELWIANQRQNWRKQEEGKKQEEQALMEVACAEGESTKELEDNAPSLEESLVLWNQATESGNIEKTRNKQLEHRITALRQRLLNGKIMTEKEFRKEEQLWSGENLDPEGGIAPFSLEDLSHGEGGPANELLCSTMEHENGSAIPVKTGLRESTSDCASTCSNPPFFSGANCRIA